jgi:heme-degrading monooxygenase HmoA
MLLRVLSTVIPVNHVVRFAQNSLTMILEVAILDLKPGVAADFEAAFKVAAKIIVGMPGYLAHELQHGLEHRDRYILLVRWERLEDHTIGFRGSPEYQEWRSLLHHFYDPFPTVEHYHMVYENPKISGRGNS